VHLGRRSYVLVMLAAVLAIAGTWSGERDLLHLWQIPAGLWLLGLAIEGALVSRLRPQLTLESEPRAFLGRRQPLRFVFTNRSTRPLQLEYAPATPEGFAPPEGVRRVSIPPGARTTDLVAITPTRLGQRRWPALPGRLLGPLSLAWWGLSFDPQFSLAVAPEILRSRSRAAGLELGERTRRSLGPGQELFQLRSYVAGDPPGRIDWKATARSGGLITREFSEDQHLDVLIAIDAGRLSRVRAGQLDRLGLYSNVAASFAEYVVQQDDRIGLVVYADQVLASCVPARGLRAVTHLRSALEQLTVRVAESDPTAAAVTIRRLLRQRALVVVLTDLDDANMAEALAIAVRLLSPPHMVVVGGVNGGETAALAQAPAHQWQDPWVSLAAREHERRAAAQRALLERLGAPVVAATPGHLQDALFARYQELRRRRRV